MTVALAMRPSVGLSVLHDRAPLFVRLPDGDLRNGYTVKIVNKAPSQALFELRTEGLNGATLAEANEGLGPAETLGLPVQGRQRRHVPRHWWPAQPAALVDGSQPIDFMLRNTADRRADRVSLGVHGAAMSGDRWLHRDGHVPAAPSWRFFPWLVAAMCVVVAVNVGHGLRGAAQLSRQGGR